MADPVPDADLAVETRGWKLQFAVLCLMLVLALVGMGLSEARDEGAWEYWMLVVVAYASLGIWRSSRRRIEAGRPLRGMIARELAHWAVLLAFMGLLLVLERRALIERTVASNVALLLLAFSCCVAGIHFDWLLLVMGVVLTGMVVAIATLEQYQGVMWTGTAVVAALVGGFLYLKAKRAARKLGES